MYFLTVFVSQLSVCCGQMMPEKSGSRQWRFTLNCRHMIWVTFTLTSLTQLYNG